MFDTGGQPIRIVVETVPHEVVARLDDADAQLKQRINGLNSQLFNVIELVGDLRREIQYIQQSCPHCEHVYPQPSPRRKRNN